MGAPAHIRACRFFRNYELPRLLSSIEKLPPPILGSMLKFPAALRLSGAHWQREPEFSLGRLHPHAEKGSLSFKLFR